MRVFVWSDLHADHAENRRVLEEISAHEHQDDALLLAGDISHDLGRLSDVLSLLRQRFAAVFFVPGNHDLWVPRVGADSAAKLQRVLEVSESLGVATKAARLLAPSADQEIWVVPLLSWYVLPEEGESSLFVAGHGPDVGLAGWADRSYIRWPAGRSMAQDMFGKCRRDLLPIPPRAVTISFSHFLPRRELMYPGVGRQGERPSQHRRSSRPFFNFSRVAGSSELDRLVRHVGSTIHAYGHQHRNRDREIDGVRYVAHSLGYPRERLAGHLPEDSLKPRRIWPEPSTAGIR